MGRPGPERRFLAELLRRAGEAGMARLHHARADVKADGTEVTDADRAAEAVIVEGLAQRFPHTAIVSEEGSRVEGSAGTWYVDPIDGTSAFLEGLAYWGPTVGLVRDGQVEVGALWLPRLGELWYAERGQGGWRDDTRLEPPSDIVVDRNSSLFLPSRFHRRLPIAWPGKIRALGSTAAHLAHAAAGGASATLVGPSEPWDVACGILLVQEAGRALTDLTGRPFDPMSEPGQAFLAGAPAAIEHLVAAARQRPPTDDAS